jgi:hypothetical protein
VLSHSIFSIIALHAIFEALSLRPDTEPEPTRKLMEVAAVQPQLARSGRPVTAMPLYRIQNRAPAKSIDSFR